MPKALYYFAALLVEIPSKEYNAHQFTAPVNKNIAPTPASTMPRVVAMLIVLVTNKIAIIAAPPKRIMRSVALKFFFIGLFV